MFSTIFLLKITKGIITHYALSWIITLRCVWQYQSITFWFYLNPVLVCDPNMDRLMIFAYEHPRYSSFICTFNLSCFIGTFVVCVYIRNAFCTIEFNYLKLQKQILRLGSQIHYKPARKRSFLFHPTPRTLV